MSGLVAEWVFVVAADGVGQWTAGGFEVALHANVHGTYGVKLCGVDDGGADLVQQRLGLLGGFDVARAGAVATLTVDALREVTSEDGFCAGVVVTGRNRGVRVVAEHAVVPDFASERRVTAVEAGVECPLAAGLGVPGEREFDEGSASAAVKVGTDMVAGAHDEVDA